MLWNNLTQEELDEKELSLNLNAIKTVNLVETIEELTQVINYYFPEYDQASPIPAQHKWPNGKHPAQTIELLGQLIEASALVHENNAMELLARARYMQLLYDDEISYSHTSSMLKTLAMANKKLQGNDNILNYVKKHYPKELDTYIDLTNTL
jgi:hypothetical protein